MKIQELFIMSNQALQRVVSQIDAEQWDLMMPEGTTREPSTLRDAVRHHIYEDAWVPDVLAGKTIAEVGDKYEYLKTTEDIQADYTRYNQQAIDAVRHFTDLNRITHLSYGDFSARDYLQHILSFRAARSYDIARLIGADTTMASDFAEGLLEEYGPVADNYRKMGVFPPALPVADDATPQEKFLALIGRE